MAIFDTKNNLKNSKVGPSYQYRDSTYNNKIVCCPSYFDNEKPYIQRLHSYWDVALDFVTFQRLFIGIEAFNVLRLRM